MKGKRFWLKKGLALVLSASMLFTCMPATAAPVSEKEAQSSLITNYDFADYTLNEAGTELVNGDVTVKLEKYGEGQVPVLVNDTARGQVLELKGGTYANRAYALLPGNPFAGDDLEDGLTLNFWTKSDSANGGNTLIDFEVAPAADATKTADPDRAGTFAINQGMIYYNVTSQNAGFTDFNTGNVGFNKPGWIMVSISFNKEGMNIYKNGEKVDYTVANGTEDYEKMLKNLAGVGDLVEVARSTNVRLGASLACYWGGAVGYLDDISFYNKELSADEIKAIYTETSVSVPVTEVNVTGASKVAIGNTIKLTAEILPADATGDKTVTWATSDETVAEVDAKGTVTPLKKGEVEITATVRGITSKAHKVEVIDAVSEETGDCLATYDFKDFTLEGGNLVDDKARTIILETISGSGKKPELVNDEKRGQVLQLTEQGENNRAAALLPKNPFAGKDYTKGFTVNFWTKTTGSVGGGKCLLDFEVAPATTGRAGTLALNQSMVYWNTTDQDGAFTDFKIDAMKLDKENGWKMYTMAVTTSGITFYRDGEKISHSISSGAEDYETMIKEMAGAAGDDFAKAEDTNVRLGASLAGYWSCAGALMDEVSFWGKALNDEEVAKLFEDTMVKVPLESVSVNGITSIDQEKTTTYTVNLTPADTTVSKKVTWKSSDESVLKIDENGVATALEAGQANITAEVAGIESAPLAVTVNKVNFQENLEEGKYLTVYTTKNNFYAPAGNVEQETRSVYFAISEDGKSFRSLNNNGGVIFSKNTKGTLQIAEPRIIKDEDGNFTVVAVDANASKGYHVFTSEDGVHYYDDTIVTSISNEMNPVPMKKSATKIMFNNENLVEKDTTLEIGNAVLLTDAQYKYIVDKLDTVVNTGLEKKADLTVNNEAEALAALKGAYSSVNATYSDGSTQKFNVDWSAALKGVNLKKAGTYTLKGNVIQTKYLNNLKKLNGSNLPEDDPANDSETELDNYDEETGEVYYDNTKFVEGLADPCIFWDEKTGYYYMTGSYFPEEGDEIDEDDDNQPYDRVILRKAKTLEGLQDRSKQVTIWKAGNQGFTTRDESVSHKGYRYIWAPEIHRIGDKWVIYFTESESSGVYDIYCHVLVLDGDKDPYTTALKASAEASQWEDYAMTATEDVANNPFNTAFCLDMTYFKDSVNGKSYVIWAGKPTIAYNGGNTDLFIAEIDPATPWKITSEAVRMTYAEYGWERIRYCVNEGATILQKDGNIFMCYSAAGTGSEYAIGMLSAKAGEDLLNMDNWTKSPYPLLTSRDVNGEEGPGHNSFTVDKDGNAIFVYHARPTAHNYKKCGWDGNASTYNGEPLLDPCRHARLKRVHWAADGTPILKMTYEEELLDANKTLTIKVTVKNDSVTTAPKPTVLPVGTVEKVKDVAYTVVNANGTSPEVSFASKNKKARKVTIPTTVTIKGVTYKVTAVANNAFKGNTKLKSITIPAGITTIGKNAFSGCKNLKKITIKSTVLKKVGSSAFKKINAKATIKVPKAKKKAYTKLFKKKGQAKTVKIK